MDMSGGFNDILEEGKSLFFPQVVFQVKAMNQTSHLMYGALSKTFSDDVSIGKMDDTVKLPKHAFLHCHSGKTTIQ